MRLSTIESWKQFEFRVVSSCRSACYRTAGLLHARLNFDLLDNHHFMSQPLSLSLLCMRFPDSCHPVIRYLIFLVILCFSTWSFLRCLLHDDIAAVSFSTANRRWRSRTFSTVPRQCPWSRRLWWNSVTSAQADSWASKLWDGRVSVQSSMEQKQSLMRE